MTDPTIAPQLTGYAATAADLRLIADALDKLPTDIAAPYLMLSILPSAKAVEAVDAVTLAVLGKPGKTRKDSDGWRHIAEGRVGGAYVQIHALVPGPPDEREAELARLRAEVEQLRAQQSGLDYSREADDPTPVSGARVEPHVGAVTDEGLVEEVDDVTSAAVTERCVFTGDRGGWCETHKACHVASGAADCGCPIYPYAGRGDSADTIVDHGLSCVEARF